MDWRLSGHAQAITLPFKVDGQFVQPDSASIFLTVRDKDGTVVPGYNSVLQADVNSTQIVVSIPSNVNVLNSSSTFESRFVTIEFKLGGVTHFAHTSYRIYNFIPHSVSPDMVRGMIGATYEELPDQDVDAVSAYFDLSSSSGVDLSAALKSTTVVSIAANEAIACQAALNILPSIQTRLMKSEKQDNTGFTRLDIDIKKLENDLRGKLQERLDTVKKGLGTIVADAVPHTLFALVTPTDVITNS